MLFKKLAVMSLTAVLSITFVSTALAVPEEKVKVLKENKEIKEVDILWERAVQGINDSPAKGIKSEVKVHLNKKDSEGAIQSEEASDVTTETLSTTQLLSVVEISGEQVETYATTTFAVVKGKSTKKSGVKKSEVSILASQSDDKWDSTFAVKAYSTVYWENKYDHNQYHHYDMTSVSGGWDYGGEGNYTLSGQKVTNGQSGPSSFGVVTSQTETKYPSGYTYNYTVPAAWYPVADGKYTAIGSTSFIQIKRGASDSWSITFANLIA